MSENAVRLTVGALGEITDLDIDRSELRFGGDALARTITELHVAAVAVARTAQRRRLVELGVPASALATLEQPFEISSAVGGSACTALDAMHGFLRGAAAATGTGRSDLGAHGRESVQVTVSVRGDVVDLSLPSSIRGHTTAALAAAVVAASARACQDAAQKFAALQEELRSLLSDP